MKIAIIDDNEYDRRSLHALLTEWAEETTSKNSNAPVNHAEAVRDIGNSAGNVNETVVDLYGSAEEFLAGFTPGGYHIIFLDIYMEETDGIQAARKIREQDVSCIIIFLTTSLEHRADAFSVHAFDYLEKPVTSERLSAVMKDAISFLATQIQTSSFPSAQEQAAFLLSVASGARGAVPPAPPSLSMMKGKHSYRLLYDDIRSVVSDMQYCIVKTEQEDRFRASFRDVEQELAVDARFLLINRGILVNMDYVTAMEGTVCHMADGNDYPINTRKQTAIRQSYISYQFEKRAKKIHTSEINNRR